LSNPRQRKNYAVENQFDSFQQHKDFRANSHYREIGHSIKVHLNCYTKSDNQTDSNQISVNQN